MDLTRRVVLSAAPLLAVSRAQGAQAKPPQELVLYERQSGGRIGVYAQNLVSSASLAWRADQRFVMCSTFKASLAALVLRRVDFGQESLERMVSYGPQDLQDYAPTAKANLSKGAMTIAAMCQAAVELSDNTCANLLLASVGGPAALTAFWRSIGDRVSRLDHNEPLLNHSPPGDSHDTTTPEAMAANLRRLLLGDELTPASRQRLTGWMLDCQTGADRLRAGFSQGWRVADKTGNNGHDACGDIAVAWSPSGAPVVACVYVQGGAPDPEMFKAAFAAVGRMAAGL